MKVFVAGATGAIGRPLVDALIAAGHSVVGTSRSEVKLAPLRAAGAEGVVLDAFDSDAVRAAVLAAEPDVLVHQLTDLPQKPTLKAMKGALANTVRLRRDTVPAFVAAAREAGATRAVVQSISFVTKPEGPRVHDESAPLWLDCPEPAFRENVESVASMERSALDGGIEGVVLRYGFFYGPGTWYDRDGYFGQMLAKRQLPVIGSGDGLGSFVHVDDAVTATMLALEGGSPGVYNVCDDEPSRWADWTKEAAALLGAKPPRRVPAWMARFAAGPIGVHYATTLRATSGARFASEFGWTPRPHAEGFAQAFG